MSEITGQKHIDKNKEYHRVGGTSSTTNINPQYPYGDKEDYRPRDYQVGGNHYCKHNIQPIDIIREYKLDFFEGNALKYLLRYKDKNGVQDLDKAIDYINMIKDNIKKETV